MNDFCIELNTDISPLHEGYDITTQILPQKSISLDYINPKLVDFLDQHQLRVDYIVSFKRKAGTTSLIHSDTFIENDDFVKINWVYGGKNSFMNWYSIKIPKLGDRGLNMIKTQHTLYSPNEVDLIATYYTQNKPYIVQTGIPHDITNPEEIRYCISCVLAKSVGGRPTIHEVKTLLAPYISN
jgi:hypothetical protein